MSVGIDLTGGAAGGLLSAMGSRTLTLVPALRRIASLLRTRERRIFATGDYGDWQPLAPSSIRGKGDGRILVDTGGLLASLTQRGARYSVVRTGGGTLYFGTANPVAHLHRGGARGIPKRNPVPVVTTGEKEQWARELLGHITGAAATATGGGEG